MKLCTINLTRLLKEELDREADGVSMVKSFLHMVEDLILLPRSHIKENSA